MAPFLYPEKPLATFNFLNDATVNLVTGLTGTLRENYPLDAKHYFDLQTLVGGVTDKVSGKVGKIYTTTGSNATTETTTSPTGGELDFISGGSGGHLLLYDDANAVEDETGSFAFTIWFRSESTSGSNQARIASRDFSDGWGIRLNQTQADNQQDITIYGEPDQGAILAADLSINTWHHIVLNCTAVYGSTINSGGSLVTGQAYQIVSLGDVAQSTWESLDNTPSISNIANYKAGDQFKVGSNTTLPGSGASVKEVTKTLTAFLNGQATSINIGGGAVPYTRTVAAAPLGIAANFENSPAGGTTDQYGRTNNGFEGKLADVRMFTRVLTQAEALALYEGGSVRNYPIEVGPDLSFSQTFTEESRKVDTIHEEKFFEASTIVKANPASFEFRIPVIKDTDLDIVKTKLLDCSTFDLFVSTEQDVFKLENSVITSGTFNMQKDRNLRLNISGEASKLSKVGTATSFAVPGSEVRATSPRTYLQSKENTVTLGGSDISSCVYSLRAELQNDITWTPYETINDAIGVTNAATAMYPSNFTVTKKSLAGSIGRYITSTSNTDVQTFNTGTSLRIKSGETISSTFYGFDLNMASCSFTNRSNVAEVFTQSYDWRFTDNSTALSSVISI